VCDNPYILCWLQQALRAYDNPVIDAAVRLGNELGLPVLVYHGLREDYPFASDRLHRFALGASRDVARGCAERGLACVQHVDRAGRREKGLVYRLAAQAAALVLEDQPAFVAQWQAERVAARTSTAVFAVNAACLVPPAALQQGIGTTSAFRRRHEKVRDGWRDWTDEEPSVAPYTGPLPYEPDHLGTMDDAAIDALVSSCAIDHALAPSPMFPPTRAEVLLRLTRLRDEVLPAYAGARNDARRPEGASTLSPYLHFGMVGPREIMATIAKADVPEASQAKFADELLSWREWFHYKGRTLPVPESYARLPNWARTTLAAHASDPRPQVETLDALVHGETADETWNACQKQYLLDGWMHNNLRMYWAKKLIAMTPDPETGWATACYLNDRLSLDGRDPSTYGNLAWAFGDAAPGYGGRPIYGLVSTRSDRSIRERPNGPEWIAAAASRPTFRLTVPDKLPVDPYLTAKLPI
jgi:deoxyribodipyrimidine photo-lyase